MAGDISVAHLTEQPCFALYSTANAVTRAYRPLLDPLGLTYTQYIAMMALWERDGVDLRTLADHTRLDPPTLTPVIKRLEGKGLVSRARAVDDERRLVLTVTEEGWRLQREAIDIPQAMLCQVGLSPAEEHQLRMLCEQVLRSLAASSAHPSAPTAAPQ
ncbi:MarR family winged helix-turn-helix transcriptional regulator [Streptomyces olivochromogenes]|uniref:MarR family winged helix-turn-helix transcriptional regulator n=1 Tax=Streptomyces olivochromogenes TaxID=1963 RepID=UPI001F37A594|nr:MarR family transcriptional regulator [Streptomyces olivochromogenes]MCF3131101.1 MarR family transcriptional regulator [Streptomyces olivochromogenes]